MSREEYNSFVESVFHPSDFSESSENAFVHALAIALIRKTKLTILHAGGSRDAWMSFPSVRSTLERWRLLQEGSLQSDVFDELAVRVEKIQVGGRNPMDSTMNYLQSNPTDLIVLATEGRDGLPRWLQPSFAEKLLQKSKTMSLFVPNAARGFVSREDGSFSVRRILLPIDHHPSPDVAILSANRAAEIAGGQVEIILLHVGESSSMIDLHLPDENKSIAWKTFFLPGDVVEQINKVANEHSVDLIVMATAGHEGFLDVLRGSVTEQVLRHSPCPLLAVPTI